MEAHLSPKGVLSGKASEGATAETVESQHCATYVTRRQNISSTINDYGRFQRLEDFSIELLVLVVTPPLGVTTDTVYVLKFPAPN